MINERKSYENTNCIKRKYFQKTFDEGLVPTTYKEILKLNKMNQNFYMEKGSEKTHHERKHGK